jgi:hypothetical protein
MARIIPVDQTEHRLDVRRIGIDVRDHHDDVARGQGRVGIEGREQGVVQDLDLALGAVRDMEPDRVIPLGIQVRPALAGLGEGAQIADVVLELLQQRAGLWRNIEEIDALTDGTEMALIARPSGLVVMLVEQTDEVAALLSPGCKQGMRMQVHPLLGEIRRHAVAALLTAALGPKQILVGDDIGPVVLARVVDTHEDLRPARHRRQHLEGLTRQTRDAEDHHPTRQKARPLALRPVGRNAQECRVNARSPDTGAASPAPSNCRHIRQQGAPERGLPALLLGQGDAAAAGPDQQVLAVGPGGQPVGTIDLILVEEIGQALGKLEALAQIGVLEQKAPQRRVFRLRQQLGQETHQAPDQSGLVEGRDLGDGVGTEHSAIDAPEETRWQRDLERCRDSQTRASGILGLPPAAGIGGERQLQPLRDAVALGQDDLVLERPKRITLHPLHQQIPQALRTVAVNEHEARRDEAFGHVGLLASAVVAGEG